MEDGSRKYGSANGSKTITTSGTPVPLGGNVRFKKLTVYAHETNAADIQIGGSNLSAANAVKIPSSFNKEYTHSRS